MGAYLLRRLLFIPIVLLVVSFLAFAALQLQPGDCVEALFPERPSAAEQLREDLGLDGPIWTQYAQWLNGIFLKGSLGPSCIRPGTSVTTVLFQGGAWVRSLILATAAFFLSWSIGLPLGIYSALRRRRLGDHLISSAGALSLALPHFLVALFLVLLLFQIGSGQWGLDPAGGTFSDKYLGQPWSWEKLLNGTLYLLRPLVVVVLVQWAVLMRHLRAYLSDVLNHSYIQAARSKGITEHRVIYKHALRNALHPLIGLTGFWLPSLFESTLAVAIVINYPTVELNLYEAIEQQDPYVVAGGLLILGGILMVGNLLADVLLAWVDPRIRYV